MADSDVCSQHQRPLVCEDAVIQLSLSHSQTADSLSRLFLPDSATSPTSTFCCLAMKPRTAKMVNPAKMLVPLFVQANITESLLTEVRDYFIHWPDGMYFNQEHWLYSPRMEYAWNWVIL